MYWKGGTVTIGLASGLFDAQTGQSDVLVLNGNTIEGHVGGAAGALAFTITLDPNTGIVTFTEDRSVKQGSPDTPTPRPTRPPIPTSTTVLGENKPMIGRASPADTRKAAAIASGG